MIRHLTAVLVELLVVASMMLLMPGVVGAAPTPVSPIPVSPRGYSAPLSPRPTVVRGFDNPPQRWQAGHRGVDLAASTGAVILAAGDGVIRFAGIVAGKPSVSIEHDDGVITTYEPVHASVRRGTLVQRGEPIGNVEAGHPGCDAAACLHWGARRGAGHVAQYLDPLALLGAVRVRLKPLGG